MSGQTNSLDTKTFQMNDEGLNKSAAMGTRIMDGNFRLLTGARGPLRLGDEHTSLTLSSYATFCVIRSSPKSKYLFQLSTSGWQWSANQRAPDGNSGIFRRNRQCLIRSGAYTIKSWTNLIA